MTDLLDLLGGDPDEYGGNRPCNLCALTAIYRQYRDHTVTVVAVGDRHARHEDRFKAGPVNVFIDGKWVVQFYRLPTECDC